MIILQPLANPIKDQSPFKPNERNQLEDEHPALCLVIYLLFVFILPFLLQWCYCDVNLFGLTRSLPGLEVVGGVGGWGLMSNATVSCVSLLKALESVTPTGPAAVPAPSGTAACTLPAPSPSPPSPWPRRGKDTEALPSWC